MRGRGRIGRGGPQRGGPFIRGRGNGRGNFAGQARNSVFIPFTPFDLEHCGAQFPKVSNVESTSEASLGEILLERNKSLSQSEGDKTIMNTLFEAVNAALVAATAGMTVKVEENVDETTATQAPVEEKGLEEVRKIGAFANETIIQGVREFEVLVTMKCPLKLEEFKTIFESLETILVNHKVSFNDETASIKIEATNGFRTSCFFTCSGTKIKNTTEENLNKRIMYKNFDMGKRARWFDDNCADPNIRLLARLFADLRVRYKGLMGLSQWSLELLAHYCMSTYDENGAQSILPVPHAFKRCLMLLSSGFFLPGSAGIRDPSERDGRSVHQTFSKTDIDQICCTAQTLLRVLMQGGAKIVVGLETENICDEMQVIDGVVVQPSIGCFVEEVDEPVKMEA